MVPASGRIREARRSRSSVSPASAGTASYPQPRLNDRYQVLETFSFFRGKHQWKAGLEYNYVNHKVQALPLHFGGRYLFQPLPAIPGLLPGARSPGFRRWPLDCLLPTFRATEIHPRRTATVISRCSRRTIGVVSDNLTVKLGVRYQNQFWPSRLSSTPGVSDTYAVPPDNNNIAPRVAVSWDPTGSAKTSRARRPTGSTTTTS